MTETINPSPPPQERAVPSRQDTLRTLGNQILDVLVIGGGIVGAGLARDAAMRGLRVGLVEQHDFAFGTSSRSSRLLHGGLRYLAQGRVGLVREASVEKGILYQIAPHLAEPLAFIFPTYQGTTWPLWQLRIGVKIYDQLCSGRNLGKSGTLTRQEVLTRVPTLASEGLTGGVRYFDAFTNDARLVIDTLRSAARSGAVLANYLQFTGAKVQGGLWYCELKDHLQAGSFNARARALINATGPWAQSLPHSRVKLRLTKGIHLVVMRSRLNVPEAVAISEGKRLLFVIPWGERVIIGTTDTDYQGPLDDLQATAADRDYLLRTVAEFFPAAALTETDILATWAGLRPLIASARGNPSQVPRGHQIDNPEPGWWDVAGGKLTTYRLMAEQTLNQVVRWLKTINKLPPRVKACGTASELLLPVAETKGISGILPPPIQKDLVEHYCQNEWAIHLKDVMIRRTGWHYYFPDAAVRAKQVADWMAESLDWSREQHAAEVGDYAALPGCLCP